MTQFYDAHETADLIAAHVRRARVGMGLSVVELARLAQVSESTIMSLEHARKPIFAQRGRVHGYSDRILQRVESALGWGWGTFYDLAERKIEEPWLAGGNPKRSTPSMVPDVITAEWLMSMILRYKMQADT